MALDAEKVLDVYLDMKSPHAYLAVRPSLEVARDYRVRLNFLPYHDELHRDRGLEERGARHEAPPAQPGGRPEGEDVLHRGAPVRRLAGAPVPEPVPAPGLRFGAQGLPLRQAAGAWRCPS